MKKKSVISIMILASMLLLTGAGFVNSLVPNEGKGVAQIEALSQGDATITCDSGDYGLCHTMAYDSYLGGLIIYYYCEWTGHQADYCPFSVYLLNNH